MLEKLNRYLVKVSVFLITAALIAGMAGCAFLPQQIRTWYDLDAIRDNLSGHYILMNDLGPTTAGYEALASPTANGGKGWNPIGSRYDWFEGTFDGQGYEIHDVFINRPQENSVGVFYLATYDAYIRDVGVIDVDVTGAAGVGSLAGQSSGTVSDCYSTGSVTGSYAVGGLLGDNGFDGTVSSSYSTCSVTGNISVGSLVGANYGAVSNSYSAGSVTGNYSVGGLVGENWPGTVSDCYSIGSVTGNGTCGGLVGSYGVGTIINSYYDYDDALINGENIITIGALFGKDFDQWLANDKFLDINERLSQENGYYMVNNMTDFKQLLAFGQNDTLKFRLTNDLDLASESGFYIPYLTGEFDGNSHKISNLNVHFDFTHHVGLFGYVAPGGKVIQVGVENVDIIGRTSVGGLAGSNRGTVSNSYCTGNVSGTYDIGGLVGMNTDILSSSYSTSIVNGDVDVGGLVGENWESVSNSYANGNVTGDEYVGGLVGRNGGDVSDCYSTGKVIGHEYVGGLVGYIERYIEPDFYFPGSVTRDIQSMNPIGLAIIMDVQPEPGTVINSFWDTQTSGQVTSDGGMGKTTAQMQDVATFSDAGWNIIEVALNETNPTYIWNILNYETYPFLSWQPV
jgi:hypothetical protein